MYFKAKKKYREIIVNCSVKNIIEFLFLFKFDTTGRIFIVLCGGTIHFKINATLNVTKTVNICRILLTDDTVKYI